MALTVKTRAPAFRVQLHCKGTQGSLVTYDTASSTDTALLNSIVSIQTTRRLGQAGTFTLTLLPRRDALHRWQDAISPMDYVEIDLSPSGAVGASSTATAKFRGFVDGVEMGWTLQDGVPLPVIRISGRDYSKLLVDMQLYLLGDVPPSMQVLLTWLSGISATTGPISGSTEISKASAAGGSGSPANLRPDQVINGLFTDWLLPFSSAIESALTISTPIQLDASYAQLDATQLGLAAIRPAILVDNYDPLRTAVWTVMGEYSHAPWYELYVEDYDAPYLVMRPAPWRDINGAWVQPSAWSGITPGAGSSSSTSPRAPRFIAVDSHEITAIALGRNDASGSDDSPDSASSGGSGGSGATASSGGGQVNNFFLTYPAPYETIPTAARNLGSPLMTGNNPSICGSPSLASSGSTGASDWHVFGWRPMERWSAYSNFPGNDPTTASIGSELNRRLSAAFSFGEYLESGVITIVRDPASATNDPIHIGDYISLTGGLDEFGIEWTSGTYAYVESVSHDFRVPLATGDGNYTMTLGVTRGEGYLDRYPNLRNTSILAPLK